MARLIREFHKGSFWHVVNRGIMKTSIFHDKDDYAYLLYKIKESLQKYPVDIHVFNFLSNHLHYLVEQIRDDVPPDKFFASVHTGLSMFINRKHSRVGHLFQGRPVVKHIKGNEHLLNISFYINLNKVLEKLQRFDRSRVVPKEYVEKLLEEAEKDPWGSYPVYLGLRDDHITQTKFILSLLSDDVKKARQEYRRLAKDFIVSGHFLKTRDLVFEGGDEV